MKGLSLVVAFMVLFLMLVLIVVPALILLNELGAYSSQGKVQGSIYLEQQQYQNKLVFSGDPFIYYKDVLYQQNGKTYVIPTLFFNYTAAPYIPLNISYIYGYNGSSWVVVYSNIFIASNTTLPLPSNTQQVLIITGLGNMYFFNSTGERIGA